MSDNRVKKACYFDSAVLKKLESISVEKRIMLSELMRIALRYGTRDIENVLKSSKGANDDLQLELFLRTNQ